MGGRKLRLGRSQKNAERKRQASKVNKPGRPSKKVQRHNAQLDHSLHVFPLPDWSVQKSGDETDVYKTEKTDNGVVVSFSIKISHSDMSWTVHAYGKRVPTLSSVISGIPSAINTSSLKSLMLSLDECKVCCGNQDDRFISMLRCSKGQKSIRKISSFIDSSVPFSNSKKETVRTETCHLISKSKTCSECAKYRSTLRALHSKWIIANSPSRRLKRSDIDSRTNLRLLNTPEGQTRMKKLHAENVALRRKVNQLKDRIDCLINSEGMTVSDAFDSDLRSIIDANDESVSSSYQANSFNHLFWKQQKQAMSLTSQKQMKWHPMMIKWCLHVHMLSSKCYNSMRETGVLKLPSERTLRDYKNVIKSETGLQPEVDQQLLQEINLEGENDIKAYVTLVFDEIKIREDLVFDKNSGSLIGFTDLTDINEHLLTFEKLAEEGNKSSTDNQIATHILVFMIRGVFSSFKFPYAQFPVVSLTGETLFPIVWLCIERLELLGLKVLALSCDGASSNRKFFKMHGKNIYKVRNLYANEDRPLYFISDVSHLLKTVRNCWANSYAHSHSRQLWINGFDISWLHLKELYKKHCSVTNDAPGLSVLPKLKYEHLHLTSYSKMRVDLAAQVLSKSVAEAFVMEENLKFKETEKFIRIFDTFFDCMNVRSMKECFYKRKPNLRPYRTTDDLRLDWLENDFLTYLNEWEVSVNERPGTYSKKERQAMMLSKETIFGLKLTVQSVVDLIRYSLKNITGVQYILTEHFSQDPLESFFGRQRMSCGYNTNPTVKAFLQNTTSLRVQGSIGLLPFRGNCNRGKRTNEIAVDETPLPKRRRQMGKKLFTSTCT